MATALLKWLSRIAAPASLQIDCLASLIHSSLRRRKGWDWDFPSRVRSLKRIEAGFGRITIPTAVRHFISRFELPQHLHPIRPGKIMVDRNGRLLAYGCHLALKKRCGEFAGR